MTISKRARIFTAFALALTFSVLSVAQSATKPAPKENEGWQKRHASFNARIAEGNVDLLMIGDSITHAWEGRGAAMWQEYYADRNAVNLGISGDRTEQVLWRLDNGNIDNISPKLAVVMIGTNNIGQAKLKVCDADEITAGITAIVEKLRAKLPQTKVLLLAVFPRTDIDEKLQAEMAKTNANIAKLDDGEWVHFLDVNRFLLNEEGVLTKDIMPDLLHPNEAGYVLWANAMEPKIAELLGEVDAGKAPKGFVKLFNGKDLTGWKGLVGKGGSPVARAAMSPEELKAAQAAADEEMRNTWRVEDGVLLFNGDGHSLCTARDYEDFEMLVDWKIEALGDSGLYLRGAPQVQIWDPAKWPVGSGGLYNNKNNPTDPLVCADNPIGEWNQFRVTMVGEKVTVYLNDILVVDNVTLENYWEREIPIYPVGQIELQNHGSNLWFKNVFIREIPRGDGWRPLFNGKNLDGWKQIGGEEQTWGAEDGMLFTNPGKGGWLSTVETFSDFELELEWRVPEGGNSGVFIRAPQTGNPAFEGSEVQILDDYADQYKDLKPGQYSGSVYLTFAPSRRMTLPAGTWQKYRIRCEGSKIQVVHNGYTIIDGDFNDHLDKVEGHPGITRKEGHIGFQNHGSRLDYRNIRIRELR
jgi:lysophospholipase L1-like esterase